MDRNCITCWLPKLEAAGLPVPRTKIVRARCHLLPLLDGEEPEGFPAFLADLGGAVREIGGDGGAVFLRTGQTSGKHDWQRTCMVRDPLRLAAHVAALVEFSECVSFIGLAHDVWAVRELLPTRPLAALPAYSGMPLVPEVRVFVRDGQVLCDHPYWPENAVRAGLKCDHRDFSERLMPSKDCIHCQREATSLYGQCLVAVSDGRAEWLPLAERVALAFAGDGAWSVDLLPTDRGWHVTDCAQAHQSWHWPGCLSLGGK